MGGNEGGRGCCTNVTNIALDLLFVVGFDWKVQGAAFASVIADYAGMSFGLLCVWKYWRAHQLPSLCSPPLSP